VRKSRHRGFWFAPLGVVFLYLFLFAFPAGREPLLRPAWVRGLPPARLSAPDSLEGYFPFRAGSRFGYADAAGEICHSEAVHYGVAESQAGFINYGQLPENLVFVDPRGRLLHSVAGFGYPVLDDGGGVLLSVNSDLSGLRRLDWDGGTLWSLEFPAAITSLVLTAQECLVGLMDGRLVHVAGDGHVLSESAFPGSRIPVILGLGLSSDARQLAVVSGIEPQRLTLLQRKQQIFATAFSRELSSDYRRELRMRFSSDGRFLYFEGEGGLSVLELKGQQAAVVHSEGQLAGLDGNETLGVAGFRLQDGLQLVVFRPLDAVLYAGTLPQALAPTGELFLQFRGESLFVGLEGYLLRVDSVEG
jgi:hypothetical protein